MTILYSLRVKTFEISQKLMTYKGLLLIITVHPIKQNSDANIVN